MILQVHDELVFDIPSDEKEIFEELVREVMEGVMNNYELRITNTPVIPGLFRDPAQSETTGFLYSQE